MNLSKSFEKAMSYEQYLDELGDYLSLHSLHYKKFSVQSEFISKIQNLGATKILVITEPWCGDSLAILPIIRKIAEINGQWEIKVLLRDENQDIMEKFLTNGVKAIPVFIFLNDRGDLLFKWGPRPRATAEIFENHRDEIKQGQIDKQEVIKKIRTYYAKDKGKSSFLELFEQFSLYLN